MEKLYHISTDKSKLDIELIHGFLCNDSYWAQGRSMETVKKSVDNSLCFGIYEGNKLVGFARIVTDYSVFAWIMDVFILYEYRNNGLGKRLMDEIMSHPDLQNLQRWGLATSDAHGLYEKYGFSLMKSPEKFMELVSNPS